MFRRFDDNGYEIQQHWHRDDGYDDIYRTERPGWDDHDQVYHGPNLNDGYKDCGMVLCEKTWTWVLPHQIKDDQ